MNDTEVCVRFFSLLVVVINAKTKVVRILDSKQAN